MATSAVHSFMADNSSDYGSDFSPEEEEIIGSLLSKATPILNAEHPIVLDIEDHYARPSIIRIPRATASQEHSLLFPAARAAEQSAYPVQDRKRDANLGQWLPKRQRLKEKAPAARNTAASDNGNLDNTLIIASEDSMESEEEDADDVSAIASADLVELEGQNPDNPPAVTSEDQARSNTEKKDKPRGRRKSKPEEAPDTQTPLERFRVSKGKGLSVTDLSSLAWCELAYQFALASKKGKATETPQMKQGIVVHERLEAQVHKKKVIRITNKEDKFGLRLWNVITGLRTLRDTGLTRELEVWGVVDGSLVNGIIDQLSFTRPDDKLGNPSSKSYTNQPTIANIFTMTLSQAMNGQAVDKTATTPNNHAQTKKVYVCDVKTRKAGGRLPAQSAFRATEYQLMLYHNLLTQLATNSVDISMVAQRYRLDVKKVFSDHFLAEVGEITNEHFYSAPSSPPSSPESEPNLNQDSLDVVLAHNTISSLWSLMISEFQLTLPEGVDSLGEILKAEYRSRDNGKVLGNKTIKTDKTKLKTYTTKQMQWWKGERKAVGVPPEEAWKCLSCEFSETCWWRIERANEVLEKANANKKLRDEQRERLKGQPEEELIEELKEEPSKEAVVA